MKKQKDKVEKLIENWGEAPNFEKQEHGTVFLEFAGREAGINYCDRFSISPKGEIERVPHSQGDSRFQ